MSNKLKGEIEKIKEPILIFDLYKKRKQTPNVESHVGGKPYIEKGTRYPICQCCKQPLDFVFQINKPINRSKSFMYSFFYCFNCSLDKGNKGFKMLKFENPDNKKARKDISYQSPFPYASFFFEPDWSLPDWDTLNLLYPGLADKFFDDHTDDAWSSYEKVKEEIIGSKHFENFSFFGGYPNFLSEPEFPLCDCCNQTMNLWLQIDSIEEINMNWLDFGFLHIFSCRNGKETFKILIQ